MECLFTLTPPTIVCLSRKKHWDSGFSFFSTPPTKYYEYTFSLSHSSPFSHQMSFIFIKIEENIGKMEIKCLMHI